MEELRSTIPAEDLTESIVKGKIMEIQGRKKVMGEKVKIETQMEEREPSPRPPTCDDRRRTGRSLPTTATSSQDVVAMSRAKAAPRKRAAAHLGEPCGQNGEREGEGLGGGMAAPPGPGVQAVGPEDEARGGDAGQRQGQRGGVREDELDRGQPQRQGQGPRVSGHGRGGHDVMDLVRGRRGLESNSRAEATNDQATAGLPAGPKVSLAPPGAA